MRRPIPLQKRSNSNRRSAAGIRVTTCEGSATFRVQGSDVRTWSTFTDLSHSGCYVELKATLPAGAIIDLELELNGVRAQLKGRGARELPVSRDGRRLPGDDDGASDADPGDDRVDPSCTCSEVSRGGA